MKRQHFGNLDKVGKVLTQALAWCFLPKAIHSFSKSLCFLGWSGPMFASTLSLDSSHVFLLCLLSTLHIHVSFVSIQVSLHLLPPQLSLAGPQRLLMIQHTHEGVSETEETEAWFSVTKIEFASK